MFGSMILEVTVGVVFVYLLMSLMCSALAEGVEAFLKKRASDLYRGLIEMFGDPSGSGLVQEIYDHALLSGLYKGTYAAGVTNNLPSYIPSRVFALALLDIATPKQAAAVRPAGSGGAGTATAPALAATSLHDTIAKLENERLRQILLPLIDSAGNDYARSLEAIENWYNASMERVGGWYKRRAQLILFGLGIALAAAINADTIAIIRVLSRDPVARTTLVQAAQTYTQETQKNKDASTSTQPDPKAVFDSSIANIERLGLPLGWDRNNAQLVPQDGGSWFLKVLGWFLTAVAVSLGAPFWFDLLNRFISLRASVKPNQEKLAKA